MKRAFELLIACALAWSILACTPAQQGGAGGGQGSEQEPKYGGVLRYYSGGFAPNVHPYTNAGTGTSIVVRPGYEPLLKTYQFGEATAATPEGSVGPWLAESWTNPNPTTYVFKIRQGVKWHDGKDFTAQDVVFTWDYLLKNKGQYTQASSLGGVQSFRAIDAYTVEVVSKIVDADFLSTVVAPVIIPKHVVEAGTDLTQVYVGTGPFKIKDFNTARGPVHVRNENYWHKGTPYLDGIIGYYNMDRSAMIAAMTVGMLDLFKPDNDPQFEATKAAVPNLGYLGLARAYNWTVFMKLTQPPFNDVRVRKAMDLAIDRQAMSSLLGAGKGVIHPPVVFGWDPFSLSQEELLKLPGYNPATKQQDIAEAKRLLAEAGYPNGFKTSVIYSGQNSGTGPVAEMINTQLKPIGIDLVLRPVDNNLFSEQVLLKGDFEVMMTGSGAANLGIAFGQNLRTGGPGNKLGLSDPVLDDLIDRQAVVLDEKERKSIVQQIQRRIYDNHYVLASVDPLGYTVWQPWVHNFAITRGNQVYPSYTPSIIWLDTSMMPQGRLKEDADAMK